MSFNHGSSVGQARPLTWQEKLEDLCRSNQIQPPVFNIMTDRRGGRTAWSSTVTLAPSGSPTGGQTLQARYWYDGEFINNAREDAAEVAVNFLTSSPSTTGNSSLPNTPTGSGWNSGVGQASSTGYNQYGGGSGGRGGYIGNSGKW